MEKKKKKKTQSKPPQQTTPPPTMKIKPTKHTMMPQAAKPEQQGNIPNKEWTRRNQRSLPSYVQFHCFSQLFNFHYLFLSSE